MNPLMSPFEASPGDPFDLRKAGHLVRRAGFGASLRERERLVAAGPEAAVQRVLGRGRGEDVDASFEDALALAELASIRGYRFWRMLCGRRRLSERASFLWHGHFATSNVKVKNARMMGRQMRVFDRHGLGRFDDLVNAVSRDPAMIRWLDNDSNIKGRPNENFARELFELFTLGRGNYTEADIRQAARAFTGWHLAGERFDFRKALHDRGEKQLFGKSGAFGGEEVIALTVRRDASAEFVSRTLLAFFVHPQPSTDEVAAMVDVYKAKQRHIGKALAVLLRSRLFFSPRAYRSRIKSPVDLTVGLVRSVGGKASAQELGRQAAKLGQRLLEPPTVEGWHEERAWISSASWLLRCNFAAKLFQGEFNFRPGADRLLASAKTSKERAALAIRMLLDDDVEPASRKKIEDLAAGVTCRGPGGAANLLHAVQSLPEGQLL